MCGKMLFSDLSAMFLDPGTTPTLSSHNLEGWTNDHQKEATFQKMK